MAQATLATASELEQVATGTAQPLTVRCRACSEQVEVEKMSTADSLSRDFARVSTLKVHVDPKLGKQCINSGQRIT